MEPEGLDVSLGEYSEVVADAVAQAGQHNVVQRIWNKDSSLWKSDEAHQKTIRNSLGWLNVASEIRVVLDELVGFADQIRGPAGFTHVMLCGMGGSSLCPEVIRQTFGQQSGYPKLLVLDSTDPDVMAAFAKQIDIDHCLFVIASKSGTTTEPLVFYKYWYDQVAQRAPNPGESFVAITDPGTRMVEMATADKFRRIFLNRPDIGGRYSALSYFGMVPAALMGVDLGKLLGRAEEMMHSCSAESSSESNPGALLGAIIGECANSGRDKLTIVTDQHIAALGLWIEQLVAESTGKDGKGILPVNGEPLGPPSVYTDDRVFVSIAVGGLDGETDRALKALEAAGHPVVYLTLKDSYDLGREFFLWEFATAFAGWRLSINPFDQPNVQESKDATKELLEYFTREGQLQEQNFLVGDGVLAIFADDQTRAVLPSTSVLDVLRAHLARVRTHDYIALLDYIEETPEIEAVMQAIRTHLRDVTRCATSTGYGPRFLHSTGQLHKGGPDTGVFIQLTAPDEVDLPIPGESYTFSVLKQAQALGDFRALASRGRRAIRVDLGDDVLIGLNRLKELIGRAVQEGAGASQS
ncbi:MAG: bifunctional transaldolase/phosoglucose isomerase [Pyrinomonadaceae bacterium]|nr:bifunctional transaldolase/phosoglucose isomerase [Pyrinomonadaceae bacterium]